MRFASLPQASKITDSYSCQLNVTNLFLFDGDGPFVRKELAYMRSATWPDSVKVSVETVTWKGLYGFSASGADTVMRYPYLDGTYEITPPKDTSATLTLTPVQAENVVYVEQGSTAGSENGTAEAPYRDLQAAIDTLAAGTYSIVYCNGGTFTAGDVTKQNLKCRIAVDGKNLRIVGVGGPSKNVIVGGVDPEVDADAYPYGMGAGATRCLYLGGTSVLQGFTLTGGRTVDGNGTDNSGRRGGGAYIDGTAQITDCVITNNIGFHGVAITAPYAAGKTSTAYAFRCVIAGNRQYSASGADNTTGIIRGTHCGMTVFYDNNGALCGNWEEMKLYNCSIHSDVADSTVNYLSVAYTNHNTLIDINAKLNRLVVHGGVVKFGEGAYHDSSTSLLRADPLFADPSAGDLRLNAFSAAKTMGTFARAEALYHIFIGRDFYGNEFRIFDGKPLCGAVHEFAPTIVTSGVGISPSGTNVLAVGETTMTFSATVPRPCIGFDVNGTTQEVSGTTYTLDVSGAESFDTAFDVSAVYDTNWYVDANNGSDETGTGTAANPKGTLLGALTNAVSGDVVHAAPGTYSAGDFIHSTAATYASELTVGCRAYIPSGVELVSQGTATNTFIVGADASGADANGCGDNAVRCVFMEAGSRLTGFTITGGRTSNSSDNNDNSAGGGILARDNNAVISDCIISNNVAYRGGGGYNGTYSRCRIAKNRIVSGGNGGAVRGHGSGVPSSSATARLFNCLIDGNCGAPTLYFTALDSCTLAADNAEANNNTVAMMILRRSFRVCNTLILGEKSTYEEVGFSNCVFNAATAGWIAKNASATTNACLVAATDGELAVDEDYAPVIGSCIAVDAGDSSMYDSAAFGEKDFYGNPRAVTGSRLDVGAVEAVWLPHYSRRLGGSVSVTNASPEVVLTSAGVEIPAGASLAATVGRIGKAGKTYVVTASVEAGGTCAIEKDGVAGPTLSAGANQSVKIASSSDFMDMAFSAADAATTLSGIRMNVGITVNFR